MARRLAELPLAREAFARGELSYSKVRAISRVASEQTEEQLVELAQCATAAQLERLVRGYRRAASAHDDQANRAHADRFVDWEWDDDGSLILHGRLPAEDGALLVKALEAARDQLRAEAWAKDRPDQEDSPDESASSEEAGSGAAGGSAEPDPERPTISNADALACMAETLLAAGPSQRAAGERYQLVVHVEATELNEEAESGCCEIEDGPALPPETARRIACDASLVAVSERNGRPLSVGRKTRSIPPALRRALNTRDHGGVTFRRPDGQRIPAVPRNRGGSRRELRRAHQAIGLTPSSETPVALCAGDRLDYGTAVEGLLIKDGLLDTGPPGVPESEGSAPA